MIVPMKHLTLLCVAREGAKALVRVEFLPYHKTAGAKYGMVGLTYRPEFDPDRPVMIRKSMVYPFSSSTPGPQTRCSGTWGEWSSILKSGGSRIISGSSAIPLCS